MSRNVSWYNLNESRAYPLDGAATATDDNGTLLPSSLICGLTLRFPVSAARLAFIGGISVGPRVLGLVILGASDLDGTSIVPLASLNIVQPITRFRHYALEALYPGVGGFFVPGVGVESLTYSGRFSSPRQSLFAPRAARWYTDLPIPSAGKLHAPALTGLVALLGGNDLEIVKECREVPNHAVPGFSAQYCGTDELGTLVRDVIVFRLTDKQQQQARNVLDIYSGDCGKRPESNTCDSPQPIEFIGPVGPDCCGNITIQFSGCVKLSEVTGLAIFDSNSEVEDVVDACGVVVDCGLGLADACTVKNRLPDEEGRLPHEYEDLCDESISLDSESISDDPPEDTDVSYSLDAGEAGAAEDPSLPISGDFDTIGDFVLRQGNFQVISGGLFAALSPAMPNVAIYTPSPALVSNYFKRATTRFNLLDGPSGALHNAAIIANFTVETGEPAQYYTAEVDWDGFYRGYKLLRLGHFNGTTWSTIFAVAVPTLTLNAEYDLSLEVVAQSNPDHAWLTARLEGVTDPLIDVTIGPVSVANYGPVVGAFGLGTNRAMTQFLTFGLDNL